MKSFLLVIVATTMLVYAKPMKSIERYNIILIHGAADAFGRLQGYMSKKLASSGGLMNLVQLR